MVDDVSNFLMTPDLCHLLKATIKEMKQTFLITFILKFR